MRVRRDILVLGLVVMMVVPCWAQPRLRTKLFYVGGHAGVTASTVLFKPSVDNMTPITNACVLGANGGLVFRYAGHKYCAVQVELNYMHRGWAEHDDTNWYSRELHYVEVPLLMHIYFGSERWKGFVNLGPQIGYCVGDNKGKGTQLSTDKTQYAPIDHRFDWGLMAGVGFYYHSRHAGIYQFETRFSYSFGGVFGTSITDHFSMASPMDLSINIAYLWQFKKKNQYEDKLRNSLRVESDRRKEL